MQATEPEVKSNYFCPSEHSKLTLQITLAFREETKQSISQLPIEKERPPHIEVHDLRIGFTFAVVALVKY